MRLTSPQVLHLRYSFAIVGINLTHMAYRLLQVTLPPFLFSCNLPPRTPP